MSSFLHRAQARCEMSGSLVCSDVRCQFVGKDADVQSQNPIVVFSTDVDKRVQTKALKARHIMAAPAWA